MTFKLYGSYTSPYVRRTRMLLENTDYEFVETIIYDDDTRRSFSDINPIRKLPTLADEDIIIFDSHVIYEHLCKKLGLAETTIDDYNLINAMDAVTDSLIIIMQSKLSDIEIDTNKLIYKLQLERIPECLNWLNQQAEAGKFDSWHYPTICLICLLDWIDFRELYDVSGYTALLVARKQYAEKKIVQSTMPHS